MGRFDKELHQNGILAMREEGDARVACGGSRNLDRLVGRGWDLGEKERFL